jgi:crotonobetainyl-CoA:carnitine CoA-transferase CaiB-like acyl-CoA transferase
MKLEKPFKGLKVIELASVLAGPSVGLFFAELGADVLKIENKLSNGDITRSWKLASEDKNHPFSAYYASVNSGKESLFLDLMDVSDFSILCKKLENADLVICNFKPGDAIKFNLNFEAIKQINDTIIYGEITGFGKEKRLAYDIVLQAETGFISMNGLDNHEQVKLPVAFIDLFAAHQLKEGILIAMLKQQKQAKAYCVSVSLFDAALASLANQATNWTMSSHIAEPLGMLHPNIAPYGERFTCRDQKDIVLAIGSNSQFKKLCNCLGLNELMLDKRFKNNQNRVKHRSALEELLSPSFNTFDRETLMEIFIQKEVPAGAVRNMQEVFDLSSSQERITRSFKEGQEIKSIKSNAFEIYS